MFRNSFALLPSILVLSLSVPLLQAQDADQTSEKLGGAAPRASAAKYRANVERDGFSIGAELLSKKQVSKTFAADVNHCCLVVLVAVYPKKDQPVDLSFTDFALEEQGSDIPVRPESATTVTAKLEKEKGSNRGVTTSTSAGIGYESGTYIDPVTGQPVRVRGVTTSTGVAVGVGDRVPATVAEHEREVIERELSEKGLPEAKIAIPVSGYLYFSLPKRKKDTKYRLEYVVKGETLNLLLP
jgi:hypothetical protein